MKRSKIIEQALKETFDEINSLVYLCKVRLKFNYFTRGGKLNFVDIISIVLNFTKKTMRLELDSFFEKVKKSDNNVTVQAFSEARQKISPEAFLILFKKIVRLFYTAEDLKTYRGYRLLAIDGTVLEIKNSKELRDYFGHVKNGYEEIARARASALYDVENDIIVDAKIDNFGTSERDLAREHIENLIELGSKKDIILFDRGYPSKELLEQLSENGIDFVIRVSNSFIKEVNNVKKDDEIVRFKFKKKYYNVRVIKIMLDSGIEEILVSSLLGGEFTKADFKEIYFKRWGIEVKYGIIKNKLQLENFTGEKPIIIEQDFYASMYLTNMAALAKIATDEKIAAKNATKNLKYEYKTNVNILIGNLKDELVKLMLEPSRFKRKRKLNKVIDKISKNMVPVRSDRECGRRKKFVNDRYPLNKKRCL